MAKKISGGKYIPFRKKRLSDVLGKPRMTSFGKDKKKMVRTRGGKMKPAMLFAETANLTDPKTKQTKRVKIKGVVRSPANRYFKNVMVKGTIISTESGNAIITNRPGQEGSVSAMLISE